ncbi:DUF1793-domain-containing protein [Thelephora ganbajun]|uniref:DUF1793-domain-containing protein n=1 Tax=Thelephora ganbajun TaxID=370292 RepID=A0ACB6ZW92_THEGA|nr:DUF1793-domain-containing protein [Thelephora ganbajun]
MMRSISSAWREAPRNRSVYSFPFVRMLPHPLAFLQLLLVASVAFAQTWKATPFVPPSLPLVVKTPYLSTWIPQGTAEGSLNSGWASFRDGSVIGWMGKLRVDGEFFNWMGPGLKAVQKDMTFTATRTIITMACGGVDLVATFLSPVEPTDLVNQSIPFSYLAVEVSSNDAKPHQVQLYTDISGEWLAQSDQILTWETIAGDTVNHRFSLQNETRFNETGGRLRDGGVMYSTKQVNGMTYQIGQDTVVRSLFETTGVLNKTVDPQFRAIGDRWPVAAFAYDLGTVGTTKTTPIVSTIGYVRYPLIALLNTSNVNIVRGPYYLTLYGSVPGMIIVLLNDYPNALARAIDFDNKLTSDALAITPQNNDYADILALSVRQLFGNIELTSGWDGTIHVPTDIMAFMRGRLTNTVDIIYAAWPAFLYTYPAIGRYLLEPILTYQANNPSQSGYSIHDIGASLYPKVTGPSNESYPVEECGNQLIMALSYTKKTSDNSLITKYKLLYDQFATYLTQNGLYTATQLSSDSYAGELGNQTNLAVKSIVALKAASEIFQILGDNSKSKQYDNVAASFLGQWQSVALSSDKSHYTLSYGNDSSWGLLYNLYADRLLGFNMFPQSVYETQTKWYATKLDEFGIRLDSRSSDAKTDWQLWTAATLTDETLRTTMITLVKKYAKSRINSGSFPDRYNSENGVMSTFEGRSVVGGHFALLLVPDVKNASTNSSGGGNNGNHGGHTGGAVPSVSPVLPMAVALSVALVYVLF